MSLLSSETLGEFFSLAYGTCILLIWLLAIAGLCFARFRLAAVLGIIWQLPLILLTNPAGVLRADYIAHAGQIALAAQQIREGIFFPNVTHSAQLIGDPTISLYGRLYFLAAGYLSFLFGPNVGIRLLLQIVTLFQVIATFQCAKTYASRTSMALSITALSFWSTYAMNNLYVRGAIGEYVGTSLIMIAAAALLTWWHPFSKQRLELSIGIVLSFSAAVLTHAITAVYGSLVLGILSIALCVSFGVRREQYPSAVAMMLGVLCIIGGWLFVLLAHPPSQGALAESFWLRRFSGLDEAWLRILPFPLSRLPPEIGHPVFVTQVNTLLFLLGVCMTIRLYGNNHAKRTVAAALGLVAVGVFLLFISVDGRLDWLIPEPLKAAQFAYRTVTYINIVIFAAVVLLSQVAIKARLQWLTISLVICAAAGMMFNIFQMSNGIAYGDRPWWRIASYRVSSGSNFPFLLDYPSRADVYSYNYSMGCTFAQVPPVDLKTNICNTDKVDIRFQPLRSDVISSSIAPAPFPRNASTNVVYYPWNKLFLDDIPARVSPFQWFQSVQVPEHGGMLRYEVRPERIYIILDRAGIAIFVVLLGGLFFRLAFKSRQAD